MSQFLTLLVPWLLLAEVQTFGNMPDASQEGILKQFGSYEDVALFHYNVPAHTSRASWEFASFQNDPECEVREVEIWLQHGSFPVMSPTNSSFPSNMMRLRTDLHMVRAVSAYNPHDSTVLPVYNPLPGTWYAAAYLIPFEEKIIQQGIHQQCRYSLGSIALWSVADSVQTINPHVTGTYVTRKHFSYFKFYIGDNVQRFTVSLSDCQVSSRQPHSGPGSGECIEYVSMRARGLPAHTVQQGGITDIGVNTTVSLTEERPYRDVYYYLLVVTSNTVSFTFNLDYKECGKPGLYGKKQKDWVMTEEGLKYNSSSEADKEPKHSFQLFTVDVKLPKEVEENFDLPKTESGRRRRRKRRFHADLLLTSPGLTWLKNSRPISSYKAGVSTPSG